MIKPQRLGRFLPLDSSGYIQPDVSSELIDDAWKPLVAFVSDALMKTGQVRSVYLRGSVPRGLAIENVSDIDFMYFAEATLDEIESEIQRQAVKEFPIATKIELLRATQAQFEKIKPNRHRPYLQMLLKTQGLCIAGLDVTSELAPFKPGLEMVSHIFSLSGEFSNLPKWLTEDSEQIVKTRKWFCRRVVRSGLEVTLNRDVQYSRDLYLCFEQFSKFYPEKKNEMYSVLVNCLNGHEDPLKYGELVNFLDNESKILLGTS